MTGFTMNKTNETMTEEERIAISSLVERELGIKMPDTKKTLLMGRLSKRLRELGLKTYGEYYDYIHTPEGLTHEYPQFVDLVSTHETSFFREMSHFDYLLASVLPSLSREGSGKVEELKILSAACSTGEEAYSIGSIIEEHKRKTGDKLFRYRITGTDISPKVVSTAARGVYPDTRMRTVSPEYANRYFMRSRDPNRKQVRVVPEIRSHMEFFVMNLMDTSYPFNHPFQIIFCRNVLIYFEKHKQEHVINMLCRHLVPGGYLFIGHSETLFEFTLPLKNLAPSVYMKN